MSLDIAEALQQGFSRAFKKNGLMVMGLLFIVGFLNTVLSHSINASLETANAATALALPIPLSVSVILGILGTVASVIVGIVAIRTFVSDKTEHIPAEFVKRNIGWTFLNIVAAGIVVGLIVMAAFLIPVLPGAILYYIGLTPAVILAVIGLLIGAVAAIYLTIRFILTNVYVATEDENVIEGIKDSWSTTDGHLLPLFGLLVIVFVITMVISGVLSIAAILGLEPLGTVLSQIGGAVGGAFTTATLAQVYRQLKPEDVEEQEPEDE